MSTELPQQTAAPASVVKDGAVDLSGVFAKGAGAKGDRPAPFFAPEATAASLEADPAWAAFQRVHQETLVPGRALDFNLEPMKQAEAAMAATGGRSAIPSEIAALLGPARLAAGLPPTPPAPAKAPEPAKKNTDAPTDDEKHKLALAALKRDEWTDDELKALSKETLLSIGTKAHTRQQATDQKFNERRQAHREAAQQQETKPESGATPASGGPGQTAPPTLVAATKAAASDFEKAITEHFGGELGKPVGAAFEAALSKVATSLASGYEQESKRVTGLADMLNDALEVIVSRDVRRGWAQEFPAAAEEATLAKIKAEFDAFSDEVKYGKGLDGLYEAWEHARRNAMPGVQPRSAALRGAQEDADNALKAAARPTTGVRAPVTGIASGDQEDFQRFLQAHNLYASAMAALGAPQ